MTVQKKRQRRRNAALLIFEHIVTRLARCKVRCVYSAKLEFKTLALEPLLSTFKPISLQLNARVLLFGRVATERTNSFKMMNFSSTGQRKAVAGTGSSETGTGARRWAQALC